MPRSPDRSALQHRAHTVLVDLRGPGLNGTAYHDAIDARVLVEVVIGDNVTHQAILSHNKNIYLRAPRSEIIVRPLRTVHGSQRPDPGPPVVTGQVVEAK